MKKETSVVTVHLPKEFVDKFKNFIEKQGGELRPKTIREAMFEAMSAYMKK